MNQQYKNAVFGCEMFGSKLFILAAETRDNKFRKMFWQDTPKVPERESLTFSQPVIFQVDRPATT